VTERGYNLIARRTEDLEAALGSIGTDERSELQRDLRYWRARLATAQIAPVPAGDVVAFGSVVTFDQGGRTRSLTLVGHDEADPPKGLIGFASPLGQALIGAEVGDEVTAPGPGQPIRVISIAPALHPLPETRWIGVGPKRPAQ
jgi:transcription elongation GreA/GreB family factor